MSEQMEIREAPSGGLGVFAKRDIRQGELIIEETTVVVSATHLPGPKDTWREVMLDMRNDNLDARHVDDALERLSEEKVDEFRASCSFATSDLQRFQIVSYDICPVFGGPPSAFAATSVGPYMNHSCVGNLQYSWDEASRTVHLRALEDIAPGDQFCLCYYVDGGWMETESRKAELFLIYDFPCGCPLCGDSQRSTLSDSLREVIRPLQMKLKNFVNSEQQLAISAKEISEDADRYVEHIERELGGINEITKLPFRADVRLAAAYRLAARCKKDSNDKERLQQKAAKIDQICFGSNSQHTQDLFL